MKKVLLSFVCASVLAVSAAEIGKPIPALKVLEWYYQSNQTGGELDCITLFDVNSADALPMLRMLETLQNDFQIPFKAVAVNDDKAVAEIVKGSGPYAISIGSDDHLRTRNLLAETESLFPYAVLAKNGKVIWTGHPSELEMVLEQVRKDQFNIRDQRKVEALRKELQMGIQSGLPAVISETADRILKISPGDRIAIQSKIMALNAMHKKNEIPEFIRKVCRENPQDIRLRVMELDLLLRTNKIDAFTEAVKQIERDAKPSDTRLIQTAAFIIDNAPFGTLMPDLTLSLAQKAYDCARSNPANLNYAIACETLARAQAQRGRFAEAVKLQKKAVTIRKGSRQEALAQKRLEYYKALQKLR